MAHLVGQGAVACAGRGPNIAQVVVANHDSILRYWNSVVRERRIAEHNTARGDTGELNVTDHPNIEVLGVRPIQLRFNRVVGLERIWAPLAVDAVGTFSVRTFVCQHKLHFHVCGDSFKQDAKVAGIGVDAAHVFVENLKGRQNLSLANVVALVVVHHVKHHRNLVHHRLRHSKLLHALHFGFGFGAERFALGVPRDLVRVDFVSCTALNRLTLSR